MSLPYYMVSQKRGLPLAVHTLITLRRWLHAEANRLEGTFGYDMPLVKTLHGKAHHISDVLALMPDHEATVIADRQWQTVPASGIPTGGEDAPESAAPFMGSPTAESGDAQ